MSKTLLRELNLLEEDYPGQPHSVRKADLILINQLRSELKLPPVDECLKELTPTPKGESTTQTLNEENKPEPQSHLEARKHYQAYLQKCEELKPHQEYAHRVASATNDARGRTPVKPLATMGTGGGPLLCDHCKKPIILEGGKFNKVPADIAWQQNPDDNWISYISGGLVVEIQTNDTLRIYHGYMGNSNHCCNIASRENKKLRDEFKPQEPEDYELIQSFIEFEFPTMCKEEQNELLNNIMSLMFSYDPGLGINQPN